MTHIERSHAISLPMKADVAFQLFTPKGELSWTDCWDPDFIYPQDGATCEGMVFKTSQGDERAFWTCSRWAPDKRAAEHVHVAPMSRLEVIAVQCHPTSDACSMVFVTYQITALTEKGERAVAEMTPTAYCNMIEQWRGWIVKRYGLRDDSCT